MFTNPLERNQSFLHDLSLLDSVEDRAYSSSVCNEPNKWGCLDVYHRIRVAPAGYKDTEVVGMELKSAQTLIIYLTRGFPLISSFNVLSYDASYPVRIIR